MIVDADTHIGPTGTMFSLEQHLWRMDEAGVDKSVTWLKPDYLDNVTFRARACAVCVDVTCGSVCD